MSGTRLKWRGVWQTVCAATYLTPILSDAISFQLHEFHRLVDLSFPSSRNAEHLLDGGT